MATERRRVVLATGNAEKREEWTVLLADSPYALVRYDGPSPEEDATDYEGNAAIKAVAAMRATGLPALGDDTGIEIDALNGGPGLFSKQYAEERGGWPAARRDVARTALGSRALFVTGLAWAEPDGTVITVRGESTGRIVAPVDPGVGLEPTFAPDGFERSISGLTGEDRARVHYRVRAWEALLEKLSA
ncbi:MAG: non-canonical purine NTP pyrophosphatase [Myxococcota bacterium]